MDMPDGPGEMPEPPHDDTPRVGPAAVCRAEIHHALAAMHDDRLGWKDVQRHLIDATVAAGEAAGEADEDDEPDWLA